MDVNFWEKPLEQLHPEEWDALCDGCGKCCLVKLEDDNASVAYTNVACRFLGDDCRCTVYETRQVAKPECTVLTRENMADFHWLPSTCSYRLRSEGKKLPSWHPLLAGDSKLLHKRGRSIKGRFYSEDNVHEEDLEHFIVRWVD